MMQDYGMKRNGLCITFALLACAGFFSSCSETIAYPLEFRITDSEDVSSLKTDSVYSEEVKVDGINVIEQKISCGYAVLQMLGEWQGKSITEDSLYEQNDDSVSTSIGSGFLNEAQRQFPEWHVTKYAGISDSSLIKTAHDSLKAGFPVPVELAAKAPNGNWTLHFVLVTGMNLSADYITVANPYGYFETYNIEDFLRATRYECYENMEWYFCAGFSTGIFHKNTLYILARR